MKTQYDVLEEMRESMKKLDTAAGDLSRSIDELEGIVIGMDRRLREKDELISKVEVAYEHRPTEVKE